MANQLPRDHNEYEMMTEANWDQVLAELDADKSPLGTTIGGWMAGHRGHTGTCLRWYIPDGYRDWFVHGQCNQCRVASGQHLVGAD